jgi:hypothetical protein
MGGVERWHWIESEPRGQPSAIVPPSAPIHTDMDVREQFSRLKKKIKHRLTGKNPKSDRTEADAGGERADASGSLPRLESHIVTGGGHPDVEGAVGSGPHREGNDAGEEKVEPVDPSPSTPSLAHDGKPDGMRLRLFWLPPLIILQMTYRGFFVPTRVLDRALLRIRNRTGRLLCLPRPNYSSVG